eukprot:TRINITY_DN9609_c0_g2_i1.p1 TRINITY_DN9609_c0_g2~~TRINITY_DN9609_c0_g2_i1.p1  ORF type:complete len:458 (+),score=78.95 TRINITY_DN9609_c0_g2_i1:88-1461(+)
MMAIQQLQIPALLCLLLAVATQLQGCDLIKDALGGDDDDDSSSSSKSSSKDSKVEEDGRIRRGQIPLGFANWAGGPRLTVTAAPAGTAGNKLQQQRLVLDTGSSTLAFCDSSMSSQVSATRSNKYVSCNKYNPGGAKTGYWGPFFQGEVTASGGLELNGSIYSIMSQEVNMPCTNGFGGIFGIAFSQIDLAFPSELMLPWSQDSVGSCPKNPTADLIPPLLHSLKAAGGVEKLGIYWSGQKGENVGALYLDEEAESNDHYSKDAALGPAALGELGWYDIKIQQISLGGMTWGPFECNPRKKNSCILDTGTPSIVVPEAIYNQAKSQALFEQVPALKFTLLGADGGLVPIEFDTAALLNNGGISPTSTGTGIIIGLPLWLYYYTVFDISARSVSFVPMASASVVPTQAPFIWPPYIVGWKNINASSMPSDNSSNISLTNSSATVSGRSRRMSSRTVLI